jgi:hypothetical protein
MRYNNSNFPCRDIPCSDNDGGFSIEPNNIKERGNLVDDDGGGRFISTQDEKQAHKREVGITFGYYNLKISRGGLKKYRDVSPRSGK